MRALLLSRFVGHTRELTRRDGAGVSWTAADTVLLGLLTALAGLLRLEGITYPGTFVFDEFYASDGCLYVLGADAACRTTTEISVVHPPLAKWLIGAGIHLFGFTPAGWRVAPLVAGTLTVAVVYLLGRRLLGSTLAAALAAGLLAFDFLHFVMSRTAMLDVFVVFFGLAAFLCLTYDFTRPLSSASFMPDAWPRRLLLRPWLFGAGLAGGAAVASKWSGAYLLLVVLLLAVLRTVRSLDRSGHRWRAVMSEAVVIGIALVLIPAAVYVLSYIGRVPGTLMAWPWTPDSWFHGLVERHRIMLEHHTGPLYTHPYTSPPWAWALVRRPVLFFFREGEGGSLQEILALGNPLVWWPGLAAVAVIVWRIVRQTGAWGSLTVIPGGFLAGYLPWFIITRQESFLYYFLPAVPFLCLALAHATVSLPRPAIRALAIGALSTASIGMFLFFRPVLTAEPLSQLQWERRIWFRDCGSDLSGVPRMPVTRQVPSPTGWCWQ